MYVQSIWLANVADYFSLPTRKSAWLCHTGPRSNRGQFMLAKVSLTWPQLPHCHFQWRHQFLSQTITRQVTPVFCFSHLQKGLQSHTSPNSSQCPHPPPTRPPSLVSLTTLWSCPQPTLRLSRLLRPQCLEPRVPRVSSSSAWPLTVSRCCPPCSSPSPWCPPSPTCHRVSATPASRSSRPCSLLPYPTPSPVTWRPGWWLLLMAPPLDPALLLQCIFASQSLRWVSAQQSICSNLLLHKGLHPTDRSPSSN